MADELCSRIEELKEIEVVNYEKTRKKKDPDLDKSTLKPRLPDDLVYKVVAAKVGGPACMNKGFILDGYPRHAEDAKHVFLTPVPDYVEGSDEGAEVPGFTKNLKIVPQYVVVIEGEDAALIQRGKETPAE